MAYFKLSKVVLLLLGVIAIGSYADEASANSTEAAATTDGSDAVDEAFGSLDLDDIRQEINDEFDNSTDYDINAIVEEKVKERLREIEIQRRIDEQVQKIVDARESNATGSQWVETIGDFLDNLRKIIGDQFADHFETDLEDDVWGNIEPEEQQYTTQFAMFFDTHSSEVRVETQAQDENGNPILSYTVNPKKQTIINNNKKVVTGVVTKPEEKTQPTDSEQTSEQPSNTNDNKPALNELGLTEEEMRELEEQREIAFKVVFFFVSFMIVSFGCLYMYHRMHQENVPAEQKQDFFDFLAGQMDNEHYPGMNARYLR